MPISSIISTPHILNFPLAVMDLKGGVMLKKLLIVASGHVLLEIKVKQVKVNLE